MLHQMQVPTTVQCLKCQLLLIPQYKKDKKGITKLIPAAVVKQPSQQIIKFRFQLAIFTPSFFRYPFYTLSCKKFSNLLLYARFTTKTRYFLVKNTTSLHHFHNKTNSSYEVGYLLSIGIKRALQFLS